MDLWVIRGYDHCGGTKLDDEETEHSYCMLQQFLATHQDNISLF